MAVPPQVHDLVRAAIAHATRAEAVRADDVTDSEESDEDSETDDGSSGAGENSSIESDDASSEDDSSSESEVKVVFSSPAVAAARREAFKRDGEEPKVEARFRFVVLQLGTQFSRFDSPWFAVFRSCCVWWSRCGMVGSAPVGQPSPMPRPSSLVR